MWTEALTLAAIALGDPGVPDAKSPVGDPATEAVVPHQPKPVPAPASTAGGDVKGWSGWSSDANAVAPTEGSGHNPSAAAAATVAAAADNAAITAGAFACATEAVVQSCLAALIQHLSRSLH